MPAKRKTALARFVLLTDLPPQLSRATGHPEPRRVGWSLIAVNNRPLGRSSDMFATISECREDVADLVSQISSAAWTVTAGNNSDGSRSSWSWFIAINDLPRATSAVRYQRRVECEASLRRFVAAVPTASPAATAVFRVGNRLERRNP